MLIYLQLSQSNEAMESQSADYAKQAIINQPTMEDLSIDISVYTLFITVVETYGSHRDISKRIERANTIAGALLAQDNLTWV
jgi:hypothetical protein